MKQKEYLMMNTRSYRKLLVIFLAMIWCGSALKAQETKETILFTNVKVFNGVDEMLLDADVLVEGNLIKQVAEDIKVPKGTQVIDGGGRVLMPGMIEAHGHVTYSSPYPEKNIVVIMKDGKIYKNKL